MTMRELWAVRGMRAAAAGLAVGALLCLWAWRTATAREPLPAPEAVMTVEPGALDGREKAPAVNVLAVVSEDLFSPERKAPAMRYRMPGQAEPPPDPPKPVVLGITLGAGNTSFATCQLGSSRLIFAHVGDVMGIYTVKSIERGRVVFRTASGIDLEIPALKPGS